MSERRDAIVRLLRTRDEHLPEPRHITGPTAGFVHQTLAPQVCEVCEGADPFGCTGCGGRGWVERMRGRDPYATDAVMPYGLDGTRHEQTRERDRQIEILGQQLRPAITVDELADANAHPYAWELARKRMYHDFDYGPLDMALEQLRADDDEGSRALHAVYVYGWQPESKSGRLHAACERGLTFLDGGLPDPLRAPAAEPAKRVRGPLRAEAGVAVKVLREAEMREHARGGAKPAAIAAEFRVSIRTVYRVLNEAA